MVDSPAGRRYSLKGLGNIRIEVLLLYGSIGNLRQIESGGEDHFAAYHA